MSEDVTLDEFIISLGVLAADEPVLIPTSVWAGNGIEIAGSTIGLVEPLRGIVLERDRQKGLPGSEYDLKNSPNDWVAIATRYLGESGRRGGNLPTEEDFRDSLVKAAAVIVAAIEHIPVMTSSGHFRKP